MNWIYVEDALPMQVGDVPPICLVSAVSENGRTYITQAAYYTELGLWVDLEMGKPKVYAWLIPKPAPVHTRS